MLLQDMYAPCSSSVYPFRRLHGSKCRHPEPKSLQAQASLSYLGRCWYCTVVSCTLPEQELCCRWQSDSRSGRSGQTLHDSTTKVLESCQHRPNPLCLQKAPWGIKAQVEVARASKTEEMGPCSTPGGGRVQSSNSGGSHGQNFHPSA